MKRYLPILAILLIIIALFPACRQPVKSTVALENITWVLEKYGDSGKLQAPVPATNITLKFDSANANFSGSAGCNRYFGGYQVDKNKLTIIEPIGSTMMACQEAIMNQESQYLAILSKAESYNIAGGKLTISGSGKIIEFQQK